MENCKIKGVSFMKEKKRGFTLIEIIVVMSCASIILLLINSIFHTGNRVFIDSDKKSTLQIEAKQIQERISEIVMEGQNIDDIDYYYDDNIKSICINSFDDNSIDKTNMYKIEFNKSEKKLMIGKVMLNEEDDSKEKYEYVREPRIYSNNLVYMKVKDIEGNLINDLNAVGIRFKFILSQEGRGGSVEYPFDFLVSFRNNLNK